LIEPLASPPSTVGRQESRRTTDERSMRVLEWIVSLVALVAAVLIALVR
jgi:hypothetical protein